MHGLNMFIDLGTMTAEILKRPSCDSLEAEVDVIDGQDSLWKGI